MFAGSSQPLQLFITPTKHSFANAPKACANENGRFARFDSDAASDIIYEIIQKTDEKPDVWVALMKKTQFLLQSRSSDCLNTNDMTTAKNNMKWTVGDPEVASIPTGSTMMIDRCAEMCFRLVAKGRPLVIRDMTCNTEYRVVCTAGKAIDIFLYPTVQQVSDDRVVSD